MLTPVELRWHEDGVFVECGADGLEDGKAVLAASIDDGTASIGAVVATVGRLGV